MEFNILRFWLLHLASFITGYIVALKVHWAWSGNWEINQGGQSDPFAVVIWIAVTCALSYMIHKWFES